jgi:thioredoxin-like negative regulator of GroEL
MRRLVAVIFVLLGACTTAPQRSLPPVIDGSGSRSTIPGDTLPGDTVPERVEVPAPAPATGGAVIALLDRADSYRASGDMTNEAATIERALRIEPNNARLWSRLAATRLEQGQPRQAEQLALKSNALSATDTRLQAQNWRLVAKARWALNDSAGARVAEQKARDLDGS